MKNIGLAVIGAILGSAITLLVASTFFTSETGNQVIVERLPEGFARTSLGSEGSLDQPQDFRLTAAAVTPGVVHIKSTSTRTASRNDQLDNMPPMFRDFFGDRFRDQAPQPRMGSGSGVIVSQQGHILTNNHVIADADELEIVLYDKRSYKGKVVGTDPSTDLAVVKIDATDLVPVPFGDSDGVEVGEWVLAVGNPFNLSSTVTAGIVSAKGRSINILGGGANIESFIQTDAAVNPGNSGGALVNAKGELVGINTAIASPTGSYSGYSFAVPVSIARKVMEDLIAHGAVQRAFLGIAIKNVDGKLAEEKDLSVTQGVFVEDVNVGGSAADAGVQAGDVILAIDDREVRSVPQLQEMIGGKRPGDKVSLTLLRNGKRTSRSVVLKSQMGTTELVTAGEVGTLRELGLELKPLGEQEKKEMGLENGVQIMKLMPGKLRNQTDIREGFIITSIDRKPVKTLEDVSRILKNADGGVLIEGFYPNSKRKHYYGFGL